MKYRIRVGWMLDGGAWYYLYPSGAMATGWMLQRIGRYERIFRLSIDLAATDQGL